MLIKLTNKKSNTSTFLKVLLLVAFFLFPIIGEAQCAMCRASLESEGNSVKAEAVNDGIVYLMVIPYVLVAFVGFVVYKMYRKRQS